MFCKNCSSDQLQKLSMVYENGLSFVNTATTGVGYGVGGIGIGTARTRGTQVSATAAKAAPPRKRKLVALVIFALITLVLGTNGGMYLMLGVTAVLSFFIYQAVQYNSKTWPSLYAAWDAAYLCHRCGIAGIPLLAAPAIVAQRPPDAMETLDQDVLTQ